MVEDNVRAQNYIGDNKVHIECAVNTSPGTSEVRMPSFLHFRKHSCIIKFLFKIPCWWVFYIPLNLLKVLGLNGREPKYN